MNSELPLANAEQLRSLAISLVEACPDMRQMARDTARAVLAKHGHAELDPDRVFLNRFMTAQSSPRTYSGWQHFDAPFQSLTLPQLVMHRFDAQDQDNSDLLSYLTGFYTQGPDAEVYDEHNEVAIAPKDVLEDFWQIDFSSGFHQRLAAFWQNHAADYRTLAKVNFLSKVMETCAASPHTELARCARRVINAITGHDIGPPALGQLQQEHLPDAGYRLRLFDIGGHVATDIVRIEMEGGRQLLYIPGEIDCLQLCKTRKDLYRWVLRNTSDVETRTRFMSHFALSSQTENTDNAGLVHLIDLLRANWRDDDHPCLNQLNTPIAGDAFSHLRDAARQRMLDDAHFALRSNSDLRKQLWIGYLEAFGQVFGPLASLDWPIALAAVGAGLADTGLNIDQAINGHTTAERRMGCLRAIIAAIGTLFNAFTLADANASQVDEAINEMPLSGLEAASEDNAATADAGSALATTQDIENWLPAPHRPGTQDELLAPFLTNTIIQGNPGEGKLAGIYTEAGNFYALIDERPYQVRHVAEMNTWVVVDPENPYSFYRNVPLRMAANGKWQVLTRAGLQGGGLPRKLLSLWGRREPLPPPLALPATPYEIPPGLRPLLKPAASAPGEEHGLSGVMMSMNTQLEDAFVQFRQLRDSLAHDAQEYLETTKPPAQPDLAHLPPDANARQFILATYQDSDGLVIGESHSQLGSKMFLIDNMPLLAKAKVKVLYLEHFMTDFQQPELDLFLQSGEMPADLKRYVKNLDKGFNIDAKNRYTFENLLVTAQKHGIRVQSIDCMVSYRQAWDNPPSAVIRQQMMNFYAHEVIQADQSLRGASKWVALVGNTHASTYESVPGISELQGAISLRVEDIEIGKPGTLAVDPGLAVIENQGLTVHHLKSQYRLQAAIATAKPASTELDSLLRNTGAFTLDTVDDQLVLIHRSRDGQLKYTTVVEDGAWYSINRPDWPWISGRHVRSLWELRRNLENQGLHYIRT